jgi:transcriptional regulator with XRE-family HTH domain
MESFGRRVAKQRGEHGWTQQSLAERLGISRVAVSHIEAEMSWPNERTVTLLAGLFRLEPHELVAGTTYPAAKAERLPLVAPRYTEVEHQLGLLAADLRWIEVAEAAGALVHERRRTVSDWRRRLRALVRASVETAERRRLQAALRELPST